MKYRAIIPAFLFVLLLSSTAYGQSSGRRVDDLSGKGWNLWLDRAALWYYDSIYLPPVNIGQLPINPPTCGWEKLHDPAHADKQVSVPGTVEEYYWGKIGGAVPDTGGNYVGVSWWSRTFTVDPSLKGKRISLAFQSVNLRAEVFVNGKLAGYDVIGNTPFDVDITSAVMFDQPNHLDIRITDPVGNFSWDDNQLMRWGHNLIPAVHGFGGITGPIKLIATDPVRVEDVYVQNQPDPQKVKVFVTLHNYTTTPYDGTLNLRFYEKGNPNAVVWEKSMKAYLGPGEKQFTFSANVPKAKLWDLSGYKERKTANLYVAHAVFSTRDRNIEDAQDQLFGFRWFDVGNKHGDPTFYLNGKRVFILSAMSRGFWPTNGIFPTPEMAQRDLKTMIDLGMNTMYMHRAIGQPEVMDYADSAGLFTYEEPGGYRVTRNRQDHISGPDQLSRDLRRIKLERMVIRDRSHPSVIMYNLKNEARNNPDSDDVANIKMVHTLDPSRIVNYNSGNAIGQDVHKEPPNDPVKLHMFPFDNTLLYHGWWDQHHWFGYSGYVDEMYNNPRYYLRGVINGPREPLPDDSLYRLDSTEIIYWGEEGAFGTMVRLQKIKEELDVIGDAGFREKEHEDWFHYYDHFLDETGFRKSYPNVDSLTMSLGRNLAYFHGRNIENVRLSNIGDAYNMNGWASASTRTDVVDMYRNPTADPSIISYYTQPLYVAVKIRRKVLPTTSSPVADFFIINEKNVHGKYSLEVTFTDPAGTTVFNKRYDVSVTGGDKFGELLVEGVTLPEVPTPGYYRVSARLLSADGSLVTSGHDQVYAVGYDHNHHVPARTAVLETDHIIRDFMQRSQGIDLMPYSLQSGKLDEIIVGHVNLDSLGQKVMDDLMSRVEEGTKLVVLEHADQFGEQINHRLADRPPLYEGGGIIRWAGSGRLFVGASHLLDGLPKSQGMSWEYQCFYKVGEKAGNGMVSGIRLNHRGSDLVVALGNQGSKEILTALATVPVGGGEVILSTLSILPNLQSAQPSAVVAKRLFLNLLEY